MVMPTRALDTGAHAREQLVNRSELELKNTIHTSTVEAAKSAHRRYQNYSPRPDIIYAYA